MTTTMWARVAALALSAGTFVFLFLNDSWRADNLFLVPDLLLCAVLAVAALLPDRPAVPALIYAFGMAAGVLAASVASYAVDGRLGAASLFGAVVAVVMAALLAGRRQGAAVPA
ncbi:MAG: hypothetical protein ACRDSK_11085 [Actinophytocola sp.]|uniref:hypothetical protein n=1 Tax=Actinophytocola sp. TaxID=1872138 RepID=UPI003D6AA720